ncbi:MAG TPA: L,D-transpeptidase family protein [Gemmatimonadaceae bacterium]|nr:L,D-transpeptidase family protein [Gemmatimonadaceae bacterium]
MLLSILAALVLAIAPHDTTTLDAAIETPTITHTPVVGLKSFAIADSAVLEKAKHRLTLYLDGMRVRTYQVALGTQPVGDKVRAGDGRTPEGLFHIDAHNPNSKYYKSLHISYPDAAHLARAERLGVSPGGDIMIHGLPPRFASLGAQHREWDWTEGCIAVTDQEMDEIWRALPDGAPILIEP